MMAILRLPMSILPVSSDGREDVLGVKAMLITTCRKYIYIASYQGYGYVAKGMLIYAENSTRGVGMGLVAASFPPCACQLH